MKHLIVLLFTCQIGLFGFSQNKSGINSKEYSAYIYSTVNNNPIPYASIFNIRDLSGAISNLTGYFELKNPKLNDSIRISYTGYEYYYFTAKEIKKIDTIFLVPSKELLKEVQVISDDAFLYHVLSKSRYKSSNEIKIAKTYFELETYANNQQVELVEGYYNGEYSGYNVNELKQKNARLALKGFGQMLFMSTETSKSFLKHKLLYKDNYFPNSPIEMRKRKMRRQFKLSLGSSYLDEKNRTIYVVNFRPRQNGEFSGEIWVDSLTKHIYKIKYSIENARLYPFQLIGYQNGLSNVDMDITKTFIEVDDKMYVEKIHFNYEFDYRNIKLDSIDQHISSQAILYAYDYYQQFTLPFFEFADYRYKDYTNVFTAPYNPVFWDNINEISINNRDNKNENFYQQNGLGVYKSWFSNRNDTTLYYNLHSRYKNWSTKRMFLKEQLLDSIDMKLQNTSPSRLYNLEAQIYLDINLIQDTIHTITKTIFDPYKSYYYFPIEKYGIAFINMYFDIIEIQRLELEKEINKLGKDEVTIINLYKKRMKIIDGLSARFFKEVERGKNKEGMEKWDSYIYDYLKISNVIVFNLYD